MYIAKCAAGSFRVDYVLNKVGMFYFNTCIHARSSHERRGINMLPIVTKNKYWLKQMLHLTIKLYRVAQKERNT